MVALPGVPESSLATPLDQEDNRGADQQRPDSNAENDQGEIHWDENNQEQAENEHCSYNVVENRGLSIPALKCRMYRVDMFMIETPGLGEIPSRIRIPDFRLT